MPEVRVVLDTNVVLRAISSKSSLKRIIDRLYEEEFKMVVSNEILLEYEELITRFYGTATAHTFLDFLLLLPNVERIEPYFTLNLITVDRDDNKFVDCAFAGNAHYIVSDDKHFEVLSSVNFPKLSVIKAEEFLLVL
ncbi:putative toxin-antitoxin system toxin component, PIN family [Spirosoma panaciterrae]|uniref:putative toxin-antitoxin system toxin component, PIN family n=1 Tax=Spirosoma panaciterrae TaxID=496058 RepID=UPI00037FB402|nr:putative toxin-antitoxin system toxin component, PIN family [Spirosoma panaciterrae]